MSEPTIRARIERVLVQEGAARFISEAAFAQLVDAAAWEATAIAIEAGLANASRAELAAELERRENAREPSRPAE